jgi:RNA polymerase sigma-70 factor, ECF subfamily
MLAVACDNLIHVQDARRGDPDAWNALFRRYQLPLYSFVYEWVRNEQAALDVVQETFINAVRHIHRLDADGKFGSWLFSIAHQKCVQQWRQSVRRPEMSELADSDDDGAFREEDNPADLLMRQEQEESFMKLLAQLPLPQRSALILHFLEDFSLEEIASITCTQLGTVKSRLHYAKKALRKLIQEEAEP